MRRRDVLASAGSWITGAAFSFPAPAIAQGLRQLKMVTAWPAGSPGLQSSAERLAQRISAASDGRINIRVFPAGTFVGPFETFDAVGAGVADMYHASDYYWEKKSPAFNFFAATRSLAEFDFNNALSLRRLRDEGAVKILKFDDSVLKELYRISKEVVAEAGSGDDLSKKIYASYQQSFPLIIEWSHIAEGAVLNGRRLA